MTAVSNEDYRVLCQKACDCLNSAFNADAASMHALIANRVPCNQALADHPTIPVDTIPVLASGPYFAVGMVGIIVGMFREMGFPCTIAYQWSDEKDDNGRHKFIGFTVVEFSDVKYGHDVDNEAGATD